MRVVVVTDPAPAVRWEEADMHLKLDGDVEQKPYVEALIAAATAHIDGPDGWLNRSLGLREVEARFALRSVGSSIRLPDQPIVSLLAVSYLDADGVEQQASTDDFVLFDDRVTSAGGRWVWEAGSLRPDAGRIRYRAGYEKVPAPIKAAILMMVADLYRFRTTASDMNITATAIPMSTTVEALLQPYRVYR